MRSQHLKDITRSIIVLKCTGDRSTSCECHMWGLISFPHAIYRPLEDKFYKHNLLCCRGWKDGTFWMHNTKCQSSVQAQSSFFSILQFHQHYLLSDCKYITNGFFVLFSVWLSEIMSFSNTFVLNSVSVFWLQRRLHPGSLASSHGLENPATWKQIAVPHTRGQRWWAADRAEISSALSQIWCPAAGHEAEITFSLPTRESQQEQRGTEMWILDIPRRQANSNNLQYSCGSVNPPQEIRWKGKFRVWDNKKTK